MMNPFFHRRILCLEIAFCISVAGLSVSAQTNASGPVYEVREQHDPDGLGKFYLGREIAQVMGHQGADWLERAEREREERPELAMEALKLKAGESVADIGAG